MPNSLPMTMPTASSARSAATTLTMSWRSANQADVYRDKGDLVQAERHYGQAAREAQVLLGADHATTRACEEQHAQVIRELRQLRAADESNRSRPRHA